MMKVICLEYLVIYLKEKLDKEQKSKKYSMSKIKNISKNIKLPLYASKVKAGFPSPADDEIEKKLDLNEYIVEHPNSTFYVKVVGESMRDAGIFPDDIIVIDRSKEACDKSIILAIVNGEFTVKRLRKTNKKIFLQPENAEYEIIEITEGTDFEVWGVVTYVIHKPK